MTNSPDDTLDLVAVSPSAFDTAGELGSTSDYQIGYRKPPEANQFKPGRSGNLRGRPKKAKGMNTVVRDVLNEPIAIRTGSKTKKVSKLEAILRMLTINALKGDAKATVNIMRIVESSGAYPLDPDLGAEAQALLLQSEDRAIFEQFKARIGPHE